MIPTYNCAKYLEKTLKSVLSQNVVDMEIWVVDDCSLKDDPEEVVNRCGGNRVKFFRQEKNVGQLNNFETCLNLSAGKLIHLLHGDDFVLPGFYHAMQQGLESGPNIGAAFCRSQFVDSNGEELYNTEALQKDTGLLRDQIRVLASSQKIQTPSIVVKREVYEKIGGFDKSLSWCEDWEMWVRISCNYQIYYNPTILASYRIHSNSNTHDSYLTGRFITDLEKCIQTFGRYLPLQPREKQSVIDAAKEYYFNFSVDACRPMFLSGKRKQAFKVMWRTIGLSPSVIVTVKKFAALLITYLRKYFFRSDNSSAKAMF